MFRCPVCGYNQLQYPPKDFTICPSCYTEFGYEDATGNYQELTQAWIQNGMQWAAVNVMPPPPDWNPYEQLFNQPNAVENNASEARATEVIVIKLGENISMIEGYKSQVRWYGVGDCHPLKRTASTYAIEIHA